MSETTSICEPIHNLTFDQESMRSLERIKKLKSSGRWIDGLLGANIVLGIMFGKSAGMSSAITPPYQISQTDWEAYVRAMRAVPSIVRKQIEKEAEQMHIWQATNNNRTLERFWKGIAYGCQY